MFLVDELGETVPADDGEFGSVSVFGSAYMPELALRVLAGVRTRG
jgi:hypothetical protein